MKHITKQMETLTLPQEILNHVSFLLTDDGGIKQVNDDLLKLMLNHSNNLISKCTYCNILKATKSDVLERFLTIGGWNLIFNWIKVARDDGSVRFLIEVLDLLTILPMSMSRMRENECPKMVKKLCKHENESIAKRANQIIKKWTKIIQAVTEKGGSAANNNSAAAASTGKEKKRKPTSGTVPNTKKLKTNKSDVSNTTKSLVSGENSASNDNTAGMATAKAESNNNHPNDASSKTGAKDTLQSKTAVIKVRPTTVKVKQGKFRLNLAETTTAVKPISTARKKGGPLPNVNKSDEIKKLMARSTGNSISSTKTFPAAPGPVGNHILKDSHSFMEAIAAVPVIKKRKIVKLREPESAAPKGGVSVSSATESEMRRETNDSLLSKSAISLPNTNNKLKSNDDVVVDTSRLMMPGTKSGEVPKSDKINEQSSENLDKTSKQCPPSPPRYSFYKDILEDKAEDEDTLKTKSDAKGETNSAEKTSSTTAKIVKDNAGGETQTDQIGGGETTTNAAESPNDSNTEETSKNSPKSILSVAQRSVKKSVSWVEDGKLEAIRYFELDETERINVSRPQADMKRFDMQHEAQLMMEAKKERCNNYYPWKLIPIDLEPSDIERGGNSEEKEVQAERQKTTLECFYLQNMIPDSAKEPESNFYHRVVEGLRLEPVIIPLEDDSPVGVDYDPLPSAMNTNYDYNSVFNVADPNQQIGGYIPSNDNMQLPPPAAYNPNQNTNFGPPPGTGYQQQPGPNPSGYMPSMNMYDPPNNGGPPPSYNPNTNVDQYSSKSLGMPPPMFSNNTNNNVNPFGQDYGQPQHNVEPSFNNQIPPPMFSQGPPNEPSSSSSSSSYNSSNNSNTNNTNNYMGDNNQQNFPPMRPTWQGAPQQQQQPVGGPPPPGPTGPRPNRFRNPGPGNAGAGRGRNFAPRGANSVCRFYLKFGKCKFGNSCNFSHNVDSKPIRF